MGFFNQSIIRRQQNEDVEEEVTEQMVLDEINFQTGKFVVKC